MYTKINGVHVHCTYIACMPDFGVDYTSWSFTGTKQTKKHLKKPQNLFTHLNLRIHSVQLLELFGQNPFHIVL